ncbi:hypothetical protein GCM10020220_085580 [Nonomuraea rubra]
MGVPVRAGADHRGGTGSAARPGRTPCLQRPVIAAPGLHRKAGRAALTAVGAVLTQYGSGAGLLVLKD